MTAYTRRGGATVTTAGTPGITGLGATAPWRSPRLVDSGIIDFAVRSMSSGDTMKVLAFQPQTIVLGCWIYTVATITGGTATGALSDGTNTFLTAATFAAAGGVCTQDAIAVANSRVWTTGTATSLTLTIGTANATVGKIKVYALVVDAFHYGSTADHNVYT